MVTVKTGLNYKFNYSEKHSWYKHSSLFKQRQASRKKFCYMGNWNCVESSEALLSKRKSAKTQYKISGAVLAKLFRSFGKS
jgi:exonuclease III